MTRVKLFRATCVQDLEKQVNDWLNINTHKISKINYKNNLTVLIEYKVKNNG